MDKSLTSSIALASYSVRISVKLEPQIYNTLNCSQPHSFLWIFILWCYRYSTRSSDWLSLVIPNARTVFGLHTFLVAWRRLWKSFTLFLLFNYFVILFSTLRLFQIGCLSVLISGCWHDCDLVLVLYWLMPFALDSGAIEVAKWICWWQVAHEKSKSWQFIVNAWNVLMQMMN